MVTPIDTSDVAPAEHAGSWSGASGGIDRAGWSAVGWGLALAVAALALPFVSFVLSYFVILVHEMGHAMAGWLYGYPSIPAFDFAYGGGVTTHTERVPLLAVAVGGALATLVGVFRRNPTSLAISLALLAGYAATAWTGAHQAVIVAMGHGGELVFAGIFLHRAFSGSACRAPGERPLYAMVGFFVVLYDMRFAWRLATSSLHRELYADAKGGGHWMDFSRLAGEHWGVPLESLAVGFLVLCLLPPLLAFLANHFRGALREAVLHLRRIG